jgi:phosphoglycerate kinase
MNITSHLKSLPLNEKTVFLRVDLNVPLSNGHILNDHRLQAIKPTLSYLVEHNTTIVLGTHIGRPTNHEPQLSTKQLLPWFKQHGYNVIFAPNLEQLPHLIHSHRGVIILLENLRFYPGERNHDPQFAQLLARNIDFYVNDAFALLHRTDTSITLLPHLFPPKRRTIGFLIEKEIAHLNRLIHNPAKPFTLIIGGGKIESKIPVLQKLIPIIDNLLLCPAIVFSFLKALEKPVGKSLVDDSARNTCIKLLEQARTHNVNVFFPVDYQIAQGSFNGPLSYVSAQDFPHDGVGIAIGPETAPIFGNIIRESETIFYNGLMGSVSRKETLGGMDAILKAMAASPGFSVIGGGDSVAAAELLGHAHDISYLSTGGGATLNYISGAPLPGLTPFTM